jgi:hypothetical protein
MLKLEILNKLFFINVQIQNLFKIKILFNLEICLKFKFCSNTKLFKIRILFKLEICSIFKFCSNLKFVQTQNLFKIRILFKLEFFQI